jgi:hypothetical protein
MVLPYDALSVIAWRVARMEEYLKFKLIKSVLPKEPDYVSINEVLLEIRRMNV